MLVSVCCHDAKSLRIRYFRRSDAGMAESHLASGTRSALSKTPHQRSFHKVPIDCGVAAFMKSFAQAETDLELEYRILQRIPGRVRNLRVMRQDGCLVLEGSSPSFHAKQLA